MKTVEIEPLGLAKPDPVDSQLASGESEAIRKVEDSIAYMMQHLDMPLQASTLVARANVSPSHFFAIFKRHVGYTPIDYFIRLRMRRACRLLEKTGMSIKAIAYALGYDDPYYFSRIFKSCNRVAPSEYRLLKLKTRETISNHRPTLFFPLPAPEREVAVRSSLPGSEGGASCQD